MGLSRLCVSEACYSTDQISLLSALFVVVFLWVSVCRSVFLCTHDWLSASEAYYSTRVLRKFYDGLCVCAHDDSKSHDIEVQFLLYLHHNNNNNNNNNNKQKTQLRSNFSFVSYKLVVLKIHYNNQKEK